MRRGPWTVGQVAAVAAVLLVLALCLGLTYLTSDPGMAMCPPFCD